MNGIDLVYYVIAIIVSITAHEFMHAQVAYSLGDDLSHARGRRTFNPLVHIDIFTTVLLPIGLAMAGLPVFGAAKPVPINSSRLKFGDWGMALVAVCGPLTNLLLAVMASGFIKLNLTHNLIDFLSIFMQVNLGFFVFNMIPWPPLDGSRILYAIAPEPIKNLMAHIENFGLMGLALFIFVGMPLVQPVMNYSLNWLYKVLT
jgi:Zn-dependent protease